MDSSGSGKNTTGYCILILQHENKKHWLQGDVHAPFFLTSAVIPKEGNSSCPCDKTGFCPSNGEYFIFSGICPADLEGVPFLLPGKYTKKTHRQRGVNEKNISEQDDFDHSR